MLVVNSLSSDERALLIEALNALLHTIESQIFHPIGMLTGARPRVVSDLCSGLAEVRNLILKAQNVHASSYLLNQRDQAMIEGYLPYIKQSFLQHRRRTAQDIQRRAKNTVHAELRADIERPLQLISRMMAQQWFVRTPIARLPKLVDFVPIKQAEGHANLPQLSARVADEKFGILLAPNLFQPDLQYFRTLCELRDCPISIAFIDIDDFKTFNSKFGEPTVDREILPRFMAALEAHTFYKGSAYRYGGDEYAVLLPNMSSIEAAAFLKAFQGKLKSLTYAGLPELSPRPTISVGICELNAQSMLTEIEGEERAAKAKSFAKEGGKNCVATFAAGSDCSDADLRLA